MEMMLKRCTYNIHNNKTWSKNSRIHKFGGKTGAEINLKQLFSLCDNCISPRFLEYFFCVLYRHEEIYMKWYLTRSTCSNELFTCLRDIAMLNVNDDDDEEENYLHDMVWKSFWKFFLHCLMRCSMSLF